MTRTVLLDMTHGSHLYGLAHPKSDLDRFLVYSERDEYTGRKHWALQTVVGKDDVTVCDLGTFSAYAAHGSPQYVEAMCAPASAFAVDLLAGYRAAFRLNSYVAREQYMPSVVMHLDLGDRDNSQLTPKRVRHGLRLAFNLSQLLATGRCTPQLTAEQAQEFTALANGPRAVYLQAASRLLAH